MECVLLARWTRPREARTPHTLLKEANLGRKAPLVFGAVHEPADLTRIPRRRETPRFHMAVGGVCYCGRRQIITPHPRIRLKAAEESQQHEGAEKVQRGHFRGTSRVGRRCVGGRSLLGGALSSAHTHVAQCLSNSRGFAVATRRQQATEHFVE